MNQNIEQYSLYWVDLNPTKGAEINKTRPCVVISPSEMNNNFQTIIVVPLTNQGREGYPTRTNISVSEITGWVVLDQIRTIDKSRLCERIGDLSIEESIAVKKIIKEMLVD